MLQRFLPEQAGFIHAPLSFKQSGAGFTLLELLVAVAIIGLIASIVLVGIAQRQRNAKREAIVSEMNQVSKQAESFYVDHDGYAGICTSGNDLTDQGRLGELKNSIEEKGGEIKCMSTVNDYAVSSALPTGNHWCVDSHGTFKETESPVTTTRCE